MASREEDGAAIAMRQILDERHLGCFQTKIIIVRRRAPCVERSCSPATGVPTVIQVYCDWDIGISIADDSRQQQFSSRRSTEPLPEHRRQGGRWGS